MKKKKGTTFSACKMQRLAESPTLLSHSTSRLWWSTLDATSSKHFYSRKKESVIVVVGENMLGAVQHLKDKGLCGAHMGKREANSQKEH